MRARLTLSLGLILLLARTALGAPATAPAEAPGPLRPFVAFSWYPPHQRLQHVVPMVAITPASAPWAAARGIDTLPADERVLLLLQLPQLLWNNLPDSILGSDGHNYQTPWINDGAARARDWFTHFLTGFRFSRGTVDFVAQDDEIGLSMWAIKQPQIDAIAADPRWKPIAARVGDVSQATNLAAWPQGARYNAAVDSIVAGYVHQAIVDPLRAAFPQAGTSEWNNFILPPSLAARAPDSNGWVQPQDPPLYGTAQSPAFYGQVNQLAQKGLADFAASPLPTVCWETNCARAYRLASPAPILPWVAGKGWKDSRLANSPYYDEMLFHVLLCSQATDLLFWNTTAREQFDSDNAAVDRCLAELEAQLHGQVPTRCVTLAAVPYTAPVLVSGVETADGHRLYRVTASPHVSTVAVTLPGEQTPTQIQIAPGEVGAWVSR